MINFKIYTRLPVVGFSLLRTVVNILDDTHFEYRTRWIPRLHRNESNKSMIYLKIRRER